MSFNKDSSANSLPDTQDKFVDRVMAAFQEKAAGLDLAGEFIDSENTIPRYFIGRNEESRALQKIVTIDGVIDDFSQARFDEQGVPIIKASELPVDASVVNCSTSISPVNVVKRLSGLKIKQILGINQVIEASNGRLQWPWFVRDQRHSVENRMAEWAALYERLEDTESRQTLLDVVRYRLTADIRYMQKYEVRTQDQYFENFMAYSREVFVDAGGFDGDTTEAFCQRYSDYRRVYLFEPSVANMHAAKQRLNGHRDIEFRQLALSDRDECLSFESSAGSASAVSENATEQVKACRLDDAVDGDVSFIKMDLEGWEMKALAGAEAVIRENRCKLAISVYHKASDFLDVPRFVLGLNPDYRLYLRHYTQGWSETVLYFK